MGGIRTPKSVKGALPLCERFAQIETAIAAVEQIRNSLIAKANQAADKELEPLLAEREQLREKLAPWWRSAADELTEGKRKSIELGGCIIGTATGKESLGMPAEQAEAKTALAKTRWGKLLLKVTTSFDKRAITKALGGSQAEKLKALGFAIVPGDEEFVLRRAEQEGTRT